MQSDSVGDGEALEQRIAEVAHDLRTPLALIEAQCEELSAMLGGGERELLEVERIRQTAQTMSTHVDRLMVRRASRRVPLDLAALAAEVVCDLQPLARARGAEIELHAEGAAGVLGDADSLRLVLQNVIENALRHAAQAPVVVSVRSGRRSTELAVADDGPGIPRDLRQVLLESGAQSPYRGCRAGGAGLGLGIASDIARSHGGRIEIADAPQGGALVKLVLPAMRGQRPRGRARRRPRAAAPQPAGWD